MYHNIMDIDIDCPKPKVGLCGPSEDWTLNYLEYFLNTFFLNQFKNLQNILLLSSKFCLKKFWTIQSSSEEML